MNKLLVHVSHVSVEVNNDGVNGLDFDSSKTKVMNKVYVHVCKDLFGPQ